MLRLIFLLALFVSLSCSKESPPTAPAAKRTCELCELFGSFQDQSDGDTASDSSSVSSPDSSSVSSPDSSSVSSPDSSSVSSPDSSSISSPSDGVFIPDANLRTYIEQLLNKNPGEPITQAEMLTIQYFMGGIGLGIKDLRGLETAKNLRYVYLSNNQISDLTPLANLDKLQNLYLNQNNVSDISPLIALPRLRTLVIGDNPLSAASIQKHIPALQLRGVNVDFWISSSSSPSDGVFIPDANLRTLIEQVLNKRPGESVTKRPGEPILQAEMLTIQYLRGHSRRIKDLRGLETAKNLRSLDLGSNQISDLTPLANLNQLTTLDLGSNQISDLTPLANLDQLTRLELSDNRISDLIPLVNLDKLIFLSIGMNDFLDISPLTELLDLETLSLWMNVLNEVSVQEYIPALQGRGVDVDFSPVYTIPNVESPFDIELVFLDDFTELERELWHLIAKRWEAVIQMELPDYELSREFFASFAGRQVKVPAGEYIDDLRIYVTKFDPDEYELAYGRRPNGIASPLLLRSSSLPIIGHVGINQERATRLTDAWHTGRHEIGHVLGIGSIWFDSGMLPDLGTVIHPHFAGPQAIAAFDRAGGTNYQGAKIPTELGRHWHGGVLSGELMSTTSNGFRQLSAITLGALSDLGYTVDFSAADPYELHTGAYGFAKPVADAVPLCSFEGLPAPVYADD